MDDEGVDLVFHKRDETGTLAVQVKSRMSYRLTVFLGFLAEYRGQNDQKDEDRPANGRAKRHLEPPLDQSQ